MKKKVIELVQKWWRKMKIKNKKLTNNKTLLDSISIIFSPNHSILSLFNSPD
jgi:hypothetical protein